MFTGIIEKIGVIESIVENNNQNMRNFRKMKI